MPTTIRSYMDAVQQLQTLDKSIEAGPGTSGLSSPSSGYVGSPTNMPVTTAKKKFRPNGGKTVRQMMEEAESARMKCKGKKMGCQCAKCR